MKDPIRVTTLTRIWRDFRRRFTRNEWVVELLRLKRFDGNPTDRGLILVQIDGLARNQLARAFDEGRMPFLKSLIERENYCNHSLYSGLPASTPSVQGELYYGKRTIVPAFGFRDHRTGHLVRMFSNEIAKHVEGKMNQDVEGLLAGGSSYCNVFGGDAQEVHFCATNLGWSEFFNTVNPLKLFFVMLLNIWMFFRVAGLMVLEFLLALIDFFRGVVSGHRFWQELMMIPARVVVVVLLRELVTIGTGYDSARGMPIIHVNLLGYDEQAHRRGPGSRFAHWTLKAIDRAVRRIWKSAHRGAGREYDIWVFSDHGQETTRPYQFQNGKRIQQVVAEMVDSWCPPSELPETKKSGRLPTRASWLGVGWLVSLLFGEQDHDMQTRSPNVQTVTSSPVGFVYLLTPEAQLHRDELAARLVNEAHVPMTVQAEGTDQAMVTTLAGVFHLPADAIPVFGADHPFLEDVAHDLIRMVQHEESGDILLIGWTRQTESTSFVYQNGAHAGPGREETGAFALLPADVPLPPTGKPYLRPDDLRLAALRFLGREPAMQPMSPVFPRDKRIRMVTYNVHGCVGMDGQLSPERIARVISQSGANIICLQELDVCRHRSGKRDQARVIAECLAMNHEFHPAWHLEEEQFGNAILTRFPMRVVEAKGLHHHKSDRSRRSALWVEINIDLVNSLQVINSHISIYPQEQLIQARQLLEEWVQPASLLGPVILCGDFNARPNSKTHQVFDKQMRDVEYLSAEPAKSTYFSPYPLTRVDHIFITEELLPKNVQVLNSRIAKVASDHLPLVTDLELSEFKTVPSVDAMVETETD